MTRFLAILGIAAVATTALTAGQQPPDAELRDAIVVMRAINTAENAVKGKSAAYVPLAALVEQPFMKGVRPNIVVNGETITHMDAQLRLVLSADAMHYQVMVMPREACGVAVFSDERGLIYTGKGLGC